MARRSCGTGAVRASRSIAASSIAVSTSVHILKILNGQRQDPHAVPRNQLQQVLILQPYQRLADGCAAHPQFRSKLLLQHWITLRVLVVQDAPADLAVCHLNPGHSSLSTGLSGSRSNLTS